MGRSSTGIYRPRAYKTASGETRYRAMVPVGYYPSGAPRRKTVTAPTYRACQQKLTQLLKDIQQHGTPKEISSTFGGYAHTWLSNKQAEVRPKTYTMYKTIVDVHLHEYAGYPIAKIKPSTIRSLINNAQAYDKHGNPAGPAGISLQKQIHTCLNQIFMSALADGLVPSNPVITVPVPHRVGAEKERKAFSVPEMKAMLQVASDPNQMDPATGVRMWFRLLTGMRQGEILGAEWASYNPRKATYTVDWKLQEVPKEHGCGEPRDGMYPCGKRKAGLCPQAVWRIPSNYDIRPLVGTCALTRPKSQSGRVIPIIPPLKALLARYRKAAPPIPGNDLIFRNPDGSPIKGKQDTQDFDTLMRLAGINPAEHTGHETRHSVVTLLASQGVDFQLIREIVGHSSDAMVEHYRHADDAERLKAMETLDESLGLEQIGWNSK